MSGAETPAGPSKLYYPFEDKEKYGVPVDPVKAKEEKEKEEKEHKPVPFKCAVCGLNEVCHYYGRNPPFARRTVEFVEDSFVMMDPFAPREKGRPNFLLIGGKCQHCGNSVCVDCSIFYAKRMCKECARLHIDELPSEVQAKLTK